MARASVGGAAVTFTVNGSPRVKRMLAKYKNPEFTRRAQVATTKGAEVLRRPLQKEARAVSGRMSKAVYVRKALRGLPATTVGFRPKIAWFRHFVIGGTRAHDARSKKALNFRGPFGNVRPGLGVFGNVTVDHVRGVRANPMIVRVAHQYQRAVFDAMIRAITRLDTK